MAHETPESQPVAGGDHPVDESDFVANPLRISCADAVQLVTEYLDDAMSRRDLEAFETHLAICEPCTVYLDQIRMTVRLMGAAGGDVELLPANFDRLVAELTLRAGH